MKKLLLSVVVATACLSLNATAAMQNAKQFKFVGDTDFAGFCQAIVTDNVVLFKQNIAKQTGVIASSKSKTLDVVLDADKVSCAGQGLVSFSEQRNATNVLAFINSATASESTELAKYKFVGDKNFTNFCKAAVTNDVNLFKRAVNSQVGVIATTTEQVLNMVLDANNVSCAGQGLKEFSESRQATEVANFINNAKG